MGQWLPSAARHMPIRCVCCASQRKILSTCNLSTCAPMTKEEHWQADLPSSIACLYEVGAERARCRQGARSAPAPYRHANRCPPDGNPQAPVFAATVQGRTLIINHFKVCQATSALPMPAKKGNGSAGTGRQAARKGPHAGISGGMEKKWREELPGHRFFATFNAETKRCGRMLQPF